MGEAGHGLVTRSGELVGGASSSFVFLLLCNSSKTYLVHSVCYFPPPVLLACLAKWKMILWSLFFESSVHIILFILLILYFVFNGFFYNLRTWY